MTLHGNAGLDILVDDSDRNRFYDLLEEGVKRFDVRITSVIALQVRHEDPLGPDRRLRATGPCPSSLSQAVHCLRSSAEASPRPAGELVRIREDRRTCKYVKPVPSGGRDVRLAVLFKYRPFLPAVTQRRVAQ